MKLVNQPTFISSVIWAVLLSVVFPPATEGLADGTERSRKARPNIVLIISDDQAWTDYGFMGHPIIKTPNLDTFSRESLTFKRGYVPTSLCRPSLATIITGLYPTQHFISGNDPGFPADVSSPDRHSSATYQRLVEELNAKIKTLETLPRILARHGYLSHQSGKWWEGSFQDGGFTHGMTHGDPTKGGRHGDLGLKIGREGLQPIFDFIDDCGQQPFFVWYAPFLPHTPHNPPARLLKKYLQADRPMGLAKYFAMCEWFDETCGELIDHIDEKGLGNDTLFVYVTDNGWIQKTPLTEAPRNWNKGFAPGSKQSPSEGGVRTPIMLRWRGTIKPFLDEKSLVSSVDLAPTILAAAGLDPVDSMTGLNLLDVSQTNRLDRDQVYGEVYAHDVADINQPRRSLLYRWCISGNDKAVFYLDGQTGRHGSIHQFMQGNRKPQLFNVASDPFEKNDLSELRPSDLARLKLETERFFDGL